MANLHDVSPNHPHRLARPRRLRRPGKPTAHKTRYYRPQGQSRSQRPGGRKREMTFLVGALLLIALIIWLDNASIKPVELLSVSDGDTLRVSLEGKTYNVRLYGIDTPESDQPFGGAAKQALQDLVANKALSIKERDEDRYGRLVAIVYADGESVNLQLVEGGYAWWYRDYATFNMPLAFAEFSARLDDRGLWQKENPTPPWEWRRNQR